MLRAVDLAAALLTMFLSNLRNALNRTDEQV
jgi:hypothetical protein